MEPPPRLDLLRGGALSGKTPPDTAAQEGAPSSQRPAGERMKAQGDGLDGRPRRRVLIARDKGIACGLVCGRERVQRAATLSLPREAADCGKTPGAQAQPVREALMG